MEYKHNSINPITLDLKNDLISLSQTVATLRSTLDAEGIDMLKHLKQLSQKFSDVSTRASAYHIERLLKPYSTKEREIFKAIEELSSKRKGALIVIQREDLLEERLNIGTPMFAEISSSLLDSIFNVNSPLHDGAVLIRNDIIVSAANILPLTKRTFKKRKVGTRHRAAIGLSEITDALIFVVSEETGKESFSFNGSIYPFKIVED